MKASFKSSLLLLALLSAATFSWAQGTAFTYQGRLNQNGNPSTGIYDLRFTAYNGPLVPAPAGGPITIPAVPITNGLFTVTLDFGAGLFTGPQRWLEIGVRTNGAASFLALEPRQLVTSVPYATHATTASNVVNGSVVKSLNGLRDDVSLLAGANVTLTPVGNSITIAATGAGGSTSPWALSGASAFYNGGPVGVGTTTPSTRLTVSGSGVFDNPLAAAITLHNTTAARRWEWHALDDGRMQLADFTAGISRMMFELNGSVGIGTISPQAKLHLFEVADSVSHVIETGGGINAWAKATFKNLNGQWDIGTSRGFNNDVFYIDRIGTSPLEFQLATHGGLGLGIEPQAKLHLYDPVNSVSHRIQTGGGVNSWSRLELANANGQWDIGTSRTFNGDQLYFSRLGSGIALGLQPNGDAFLQGTLTCRVLTITGGADIAEPFQMSSSEIPKGSVVVIDEANPGHLKMSTEAYDKRVAGIVSGANGIKPGISLHQEGALEGGENVALSGRVYVQADAAGGAIKPGDLLTTSDTPGHAMKVGDHAKAQGAILGKAMTALKNGRGMVLVLVTLQ